MSNNPSFFEHPVLSLLKLTFGSRQGLITCYFRSMDPSEALQHDAFGQFHTG
jgi:hypothetical protein